MPKSGTLFFRFCLTVFLSVFPRLACADIPQKIDFQGRMVDPLSKDPLNGSFDTIFRICDSLAGACVGGSKLWEESKTVVVSTGAFEVEMGSVVPVSSAVFAGSEQYLEFEVEGEALSPRHRMVSAPFVFRAAIADSIAAGVGGLIQVRDTLQAGATFYVSSGSVSGNFAVLGKLTVGGSANVTGALTVSGVITAGSGQNQITTAAGLLEPSKIDSATTIPAASISPSTAVKYNASGKISSFFINSSSVTKKGNTFNVPNSLVLLDGSARIGDTLISNSSITMLANAFNTADGPVKIRSDGMIENYLIAGSSIAKLAASGLVPMALIDSSSVTMQANIFNQADRLFKLDQNGNAVVTYGVSAATGVFNVNVGINESAPQEKLHLSAVNAKVEGGTFLTQDSDVIFSTTSGSHGITFQDESFQYSEPRWEFVEEVAGNDPLAITGLNGNEDDMYLIAFEVQANGGAEWGVRLNGNALNYQLHNLNSISGTNGIHSDQNANWDRWQVAGDLGQGNGDQWSGEMVIWAKTGQKRYMIYHSLRNDGGNIEFEQGGGWWDDATSNVTSIDFVGNFAAVSTFRLYRRPR